MNHCVKCAYPVSPGGYDYIIQNKRLAKICSFCESVYKNIYRIFKKEDILFLTGHCSECLQYISSDNEPNLNVSILHERNVICDREYCRDCFIPSKYQKINNFDFDMVVWYENVYELTIKSRNIKPVTIMGSRRKRERRKPIDSNELCS